jgi:hypothetical protein
MWGRTQITIFGTQHLVFVITSPRVLFFLPVELDPKL